MITESTVLVLGAGASAPYGFPTANQLKWEVARGSIPRVEELLTRSQGYMRSGIERFRQTLVEVRVGSIDSLLERVPQTARSIGKHLIAGYLLTYEERSRKTVDSPFFLTKDDWMGTVFELMDRGAEDPDVFLRNEVTIVTFNYDRSFEQAYYLHVKHKFRLQDHQAVDVTRRFVSERVYHVYGQLGAWAPDEHDSSGIIYGLERFGAKEVFRAGDEGIKIIHEDNGDNDRLIKIKDAIQSAVRVIFLGFGYDRLNLERIMPEAVKVGSSWFGTALGLRMGQQLLAKHSAIWAGIAENSNGQGRHLALDLYPQLNSSQLLDEILHVFK